MRTGEVTRIIAAVAVTVVSIGALSACSSPAEEIAESVAEQAVEEAVGGEVDISGDSVTVTDADGNEVAVGSSVVVPDSWPAALPRYDGTLAMVSVQADGSVYAMWTTETTPEDAAAAYGAQLEAAGYAMEQEAQMVDTVIREYRSATMTVSVVAGTAEGVTNLTVSATAS